MENVITNILDSEGGITKNIVNDDSQVNSNRETFQNAGSYEFIDLNERWRTYYYADGTEQTIIAVQKLAVSKSGHRLFTADGLSHFVPFGWIRVSWKVVEGTPNFLK